MKILRRINKRYCCIKKSGPYDNIDLIRGALVELMQSIGPVRAQAMFGGHGIFLEQLIFGLVADSVL
jgi:hypothetical protein